jgi:hypothetical protein
VLQLEQSASNSTATVSYIDRAVIVRTFYPGV